MSTSAVRVDGSKVRIWATKRDAIAAAKSIGWAANSVWSVETRFCGGFALYNNANDFLSREDFGRLFLDRNGEAAYLKAAQEGI